MIKIRQATDAFARIDRTPEEGVKGLDQALRHITQRLGAFRPVAREGRVDLYSLPAICALRLVQVADVFGLERSKLDAFARHLQIASERGRRVAVPGGFRTMSPIEEAVERVREGQTFDFNCAFYKGGRVVWSADWPNDDPEAEAFTDQFFAGWAEEPVATFTVHGSRLILEVLDALQEAN